jgi:hypothetical protein
LAERALAIVARRVIEDQRDPAQFSDLLDLLADKERYERVEAKIRRQKMKAVG